MSAGYSGTPLVRKLGIENGFTVVTVGRPSNYLELIDPVPAGVRILRAEDDSSIGPIDLVHVFTNSRDDLFRELGKYVRRIRPAGMIWVSWYKKAAKLPTEITEDTIREAAFPLGLVDVKVFAIDEKWSGLKLVIRKENRV